MRGRFGDVKTPASKFAQELLGHVNSRITTDVYTRAMYTEKRNASGLHVGLLRGEQELGMTHPESSSEVAESNIQCRKPFIEWFMAGTTGLEPATSAVTEHPEHVSDCNRAQRLALLEPCGTVGKPYRTLIEPTSSAVTTSARDLCRTHPVFLAEVSGEVASVVLDGYFLF